jgi:transposase
MVAVPGYTFGGFAGDSGNAQIPAQPEQPVAAIDDQVTTLSTRTVDKLILPFPESHPFWFIVYYF